MLFILAGALLGSEHLLQSLVYKPAASAATVPTNNNAAAVRTDVARISGNPVHISIPSVGISVDIEKGYYNASNQTWTLSKTKAEFATVTNEPNNQGGNTFIYGHNRPQVFNKLLQVSTGSSVIITTDNGHTFTYMYKSVRDTKPTDTSLFEYQGDPILTLQTCSGVWYENRRLFTFNLVEAK